MKKKIALAIIFTLVFSIMFNINQNIISIADTFNISSSGYGPILRFSNIENKDTDVPINKTITLTFDKNIELGYGSIALFDTDTSREENIKITIDGNKLTIKPVRNLKSSSRYMLLLEEDSIVDLDGNSIDEISYSFVTGKESENGDDKTEDKEEKTYGSEFGQAVGQLNGYMDFLDGKKNNWSRAIPSSKEIINEYNLSKETIEYRDTFLKDFEEGFKKGYEEAFRSENFDIIIKSHEEGKDQGEFFGALLGEAHGRRDFYNNESNDWTRWLPLDKDIVKDYNLSNNNDAYLESFVKAFKNSYKLSYTSTFRLINVDDNKVIKENGLAHGQAIGRLSGENQGKLDYIAGKNNDWKSSLPNDDILIERYNLNREADEYKEGFLVGYKDSFRAGYVLSFQYENLEVAEGNLNIDYISMKGGEVSSFDQGMRLKVEPGSFYLETALGIEKLNIDNIPPNPHIIPATSSYNVKVQNISNSINLKKPIKLEFQYYGSKSAGIYELRNGKWFYLYSTIEDTIIYTNINTNTYSGGAYIVLIDERYEALDDIGGHWAEKAIETFLKRNYINGYPDKTFRPDQSITRAEFIKILDNVYNWDKYLPFINMSSSRFKDSSVFGPFADSISKAVFLGYINGYSDNTFRPHISITYQEIEWIIQRITGKSDFKWDIVAEQILKDYYISSKSYNSKQNYITRSEVVYLLHLLEEGYL